MTNDRYAFCIGAGAVGLVLGFVLFCAAPIPGVIVMLAAFGGIGVAYEKHARRPR